MNGVVLSWWPAWGEGAVLYAGTALAWALGLYVATRGGLRRVSLLAVLAVGALTPYLLGQALGALAPDRSLWVAWLRGTWWGAALAPALWFLTTLTLAVDEGPEDQLPRLRRQFWPVAVVALALGGLLAVAGTVGDLIIHWSASPAGNAVLHVGMGAERWHVPRGPLYVAYQAYVLICATWAAGNLFVLWRCSPPATPLRARFGWLLVSAALFLLSGGYLSIAMASLAFPGLPGLGLLVAGILIALIPTPRPRKRWEDDSGQPVGWSNDPRAPYAG
jgi:hypothetical protein